MISASSVIDLDVEKSGTFKTTDFRIKNNAKMFKILSSGLYKNKIRAILREFSTNACDSHIVNGNINEPFVVKLPNAIDPTFSIRDYGTGLDEHEIREIYTTYGESTKDSLNTLNGTFGLGAKSVFSYTDSSTLISIKNGIKTTYSLHMNERGIPECARLTATKTQDRSGIEIVIPVQRNDFEQFRREAELVYTFFDIKPIVKGNSSYRENKFTNPPVMEDIGSWAVYNSSNDIRLFDESKAICVMGNCAYPIDLNTVGISYGHWLYQNSFVVMHVGIGDVDITVSREALEYIPHTVNCLKAKIVDIEKKYREKLEAEIDQCPSYYDACHKYYDQPLCINNIKYKHKPIKQYVDNPLYDSTAASQDVLEFYHYHQSSKPYNIQNFRLDHQYAFFLDDLDKGSHTRLVNYLNGSTGNGILLKTNDPVKLKTFKDALGLLDSHIQLTSSLPEPPKKTRAKQVKIGGYQLKSKNTSRYGRDNMSDCWLRLEDLPPGAIVVEFEQYYAIDANKKKVRPQDLRHQIESLPKSFNIDKDAIYALSKEKFKKSPAKGFVDFWALLRSAVEKELKTNKAEYEALLEYNQLLGETEMFPNLSEVFNHFSKIQPLTNPPLLSKIKGEHDKVIKIKKKDNPNKVMALIEEYFPNSLKASDIMRPLLIELYSKAPLLRHIEFEQNYYNKTKMNGVFDNTKEYLQMVLK